METLIHLIRSDIRQKASWCYDGDDPHAIAKTIFTDGTLAMVLYRLMQSSRRSGLAPLELLFNKLNAVFGGCIIGRGADFGPGFVLIHANGVVINGNVRGGANIHLEHQVTIGAEKRASPILGDDVFVGAGAKIIGAVIIGDGARIGANAVVVRDVAPRTTVVGIPAVPIARRDAGSSKSSAGNELDERDRVGSATRSGRADT